MKLSELFEDYFSPLRLRGKSPNTTRLYRCTLRSYDKFLGRPAEVERDLDDLQLARFLSARASVRSPYTAERERNQIVSLWRFASDRRIVDSRPCVPPASRLPERIPSVWSADQLRHLISVAGATPGIIGDAPAGIFWRALISTLYESAERISAIMGTTVGDWQSPRLLVRAEHRKGGKRDRMYTLTSDTCDLVNYLCRGHSPDDKIFRWDRNWTYLWSKFGDIVEAAGLPGGRRAKFHQLRRCAASFYAAAGGNPTQLLDHSSPKITRAYLDPRYTELGTPPSHVLPPLHKPAGGDSPG